MTPKVLYVGAIDLIFSGGHQSFTWVLSFTPASRFLIVRFFVACHGHLALLMFENVSIPIQLPMMEYCFSAWIDGKFVIGLPRKVYTECWYVRWGNRVCNSDGLCISFDLHKYCDTLWIVILLTYGKGGWEEFLINNIIMMEEKRWKLCDVHCESMLDVFWLLSHSNVFLQEEVIFAGAIDGWGML